MYYVCYIYIASRSIWKNITTRDSLQQKKSLPYNFLPHFFCDRVVLFYVYSLFTRIVILERHCLLDKCEWTKSFETSHTTEKHYSCLLCATFAQYAETMDSCKYADSSAPRNIFTKLFVINAKHYIESLHAPHKRCHFIIRLYSRDEIANKNKTTEP